MNVLKPFEIPITGLQIGIHKFHFDIDDSFLESFESTYKKGQLKVEVELDKKPSLIEVDFRINGTLEMPCDRCMEEIDLPIVTDNYLVFKYAEAESEEDEIVYILSSTINLDLAQYIYEFIMLGVPLRKVKDCEAEDFKDCNKKILAYLDNQEIEEEVEVEEESQLAKALKNININQKK